MFRKGLLLIGGFMCLGWMILMFVVFLAEFYAPFYVKHEHLELLIAPVFLVRSQAFLQTGLAATILTMLPIVTSNSI